MKTTCLLVSLFVLAACGRQPAEPIGIYRLGTAEKTMVLEVRASGDYVLQIDGPDSMTEEIRGRWDEARSDKADATFHGLAWRGEQPEPARALWPVKFDSAGGICIDAAGSLCFTKDGEA
ncbi:hypothetical protein [Massilia suwonensis]|uniref:Lipoprotein n=1 Tax=Massilia suwonensis TaxID=648895 RepID=A0ABW0MQ74_9BURK